MKSYSLYSFMPGFFTQDNVYEIPTHFVVRQFIFLILLSSIPFYKYTIIGLFILLSMNIDLSCLYLGLLWIKLLRTILYSLLWTYVLTSIWYILGVKFLGHYISFCLDGCNILLAVMPATWCQSPNLVTRPYSFSQNRTLSTSKILGSPGGLP